MRRSNLYLQLVMLEAARRVSIPRRKVIDKPTCEFTTDDEAALINHHSSNWEIIAEANRVLGSHVVNDAINYVDADAKAVCQGLLDDFYRQPVSVRKAGRNDPCYCGSGNKFKKCCGG